MTIQLKVTVNSPRSYHGTGPPVSDVPKKLSIHGKNAVAANAAAIPNTTRTPVQNAAQARLPFK